MTMVSYASERNLAQQGLISTVGNAQLLMAHDQLLINYEFTLFNDGVLNETVNVHCTYKNQDKK